MSNPNQNQKHYKTQELLLEELSLDPHSKPSDEVLEFVAQSLIHPVAAISSLALKRLLQSPTSPAARRFAEAALADMDTFVEQALLRDPIKALSRLAEASQSLRKDLS